MSNTLRTISYLKRNGIKNTCDTIRERLDRVHLEPIQRELAGYEGARFWSDSHRQAAAVTCRAHQSAHRFKKEYVFSILVPAYETKQQYLREMMDSVMCQTYSRVELIIADASESDKVLRTVQAYMEHELAALKGKAGKPEKAGKKEKQQDSEKYQAEADDKAEEDPYKETYPSIRYIRLEKNDGIAANTNAALLAASGDYIGLIDHDDALTYDALYEIMEKLQEAPYELIYTDEDKADGRMEHFHAPHHKTGFNLPLLLSNNYICHFALLKAELMRELRFRPEYDGAQDYDLFLRAVTAIKKQKAGTERAGDGGWDPDFWRSKIAHVDKILYHWRCHENSTADNPESKRYAYEAGKRAVEDFCRQQHMDVWVEHSMHLGFYLLKSDVSVWEIYPNVGAVCGRVFARRKVIGGPSLDGRELFSGLLKGYSGYLNRADFPIWVDAMDERAALFHPKYEEIFHEMETGGKPLSFEQKMEYVKRQGEAFLYVPWFDKL